MAMTGLANKTKMRNFMTMVPLGYCNDGIVLLLFQSAGLVNIGRFDSEEVSQSEDSGLVDWQETRMHCSIRFKSAANQNVQRTCGESCRLLVRTNKRLMKAVNKTGNDISLSSVEV